LKKLVDYLVLPRAITDFERQYLKRTNRVGLWFFCAHVPLMMLVALLNGTGVVLAALLTVLVLAGPVLANVGFENPRATSVSYGFTAMMMGALLVHFGQGPIQIEMHFYFFVLIALLAVFANPLVIIVAAVTVALHHLLLWSLLPASVFNYAAPAWVVLVHALFVVLESIASCFIARSFFDNVIGLEKIVEARTAELEARHRDMRVVLDNVDQVLLTLDPDAVVGPETSATCHEWLGDAAGRRLVDILAEKAPASAACFDLGWQQYVEDFLPADLTLSQLPSDVVIDGRTLRLTYKEIDHGEGKRVLVVGSDVTSELARALLEIEQKETLRVFERVLADKRGFLEFFEEANGLVEAIVGPGVESDELTLTRRIHTLKGTSALFGVQTIASLCHDIESGMLEEQRSISDSERSQLARSWSRLCKNLETFLGRRGGVEIDDEQFEAILTALVRRRPHDEIARAVARWKLEAAEVRLGRLAEQAQTLALRLGKAALDVQIRCDAVFLDPPRWAPFWASFVHAVRNAVDHGIESAEERLRQHKSERGQLVLEARLDGGELVVAIADDGRGIDWRTLELKASAQGLPTGGHDDLVAALFADGVSTAAQVSDISGRGVGMGALRAACEALGGRVRVLAPRRADGNSAPGGTRMEFRFPRRVFEVEPGSLLQARAA
jgi:two-component system, chemotaxis family, sensor kinase CheA